MKTFDPNRFDPGLLLHEVELYLAAVESFRAEGCAPFWLSEASGWTAIRGERDPRTVLQKEVLK